MVLKLRQIAVQAEHGKSLELACKEAELSEQSYYRGRKEYGGLQVDQARKMKDLERENARLLPARRESNAIEGGTGGRCLRKLVAPRTTPGGSGGHPGEVRPLGTPCLPDRRPAWRRTALRTHPAGRRGWPDPSHHRLGVRVCFLPFPLKLPPAECTLARPRCNNGPSPLRL